MVHPKSDSNQTPQQKPSNAQKPQSRKKKRFAEETKEDAKVNGIKVRINSTVSKVSSETD